MVRAQITPQTAQILVTVPEDYIGSPVEVLIFKESERTATFAADVLPGHTNAHLRGSLQMDSKRYEEFQSFLNETRREWDR